nr:c-type cytochrome [Polynucleobacter necessarius]
MRASCHASGAAGAPKFGDAGAWSSRLDKGYDGLLTSVLKGKGAMPACGGASPTDVSEYELGRAVVCLANSAGGKLPEPKAPLLRNNCLYPL